MKRQALVAVLLCALGSSGQAQPAGRVELTTRAPHAATEADLARLRNGPQVELQRLQREQAAACQSKANAAECDRKTRQLNAARPALENKIAWVGRHESDARRGVLVLRERGPTPVPPGNNCMTCHTGAGATPAGDPIHVGVGASPAQDPMAPGPGSPGPQPGSMSGGGKVVPPATRCFIATAAFGTADAEEVVALRRFRDQHLVGSPAGDWFVRTYYRVSPAIADAIAERPALRAGVRGLLRGVVFAIRSPASFAMLFAAGLVVLVAMRRWRRRAIG